MAKHRKHTKVRKLFGRAWVAWQEQSAIAYGVHVQVDGDVFGDKHVDPSPLVTEVHEHTEIHAKGRTF